ncbi:MAG TPA: isoprenylcysteine carboxylmethyltransferase family protein, partial [Caldilineaceae bacterium]|nr:isoprenylcysteine carboxylmethyltransferase family protein [Caldilineaceae bacterium]
MDQSSLFHWSFVLVFLATFAISGFYRRRARQSGEAIRRSQESRMVILLRVFFALPFYLAALTYMVNPAWMDWSAMSMPLWLRLLATVVALALIPVIYWTMRSIGNNVSETYLTKTNHVLVTHGPYRWVRHPIYTVATTLFVALSMGAANCF